MSQMTDEEWQHLYENFETTDLLAAVDHLDQVRGVLGDGPNWEPPEMRINLLKLHQLAMDVVNKGYKGQAQEMFDLANDLDMEVFGIIESLEAIQRVLTTLTDLYPESLSYDD
ncbi:transposase [Acaryochloris sp. IP29b_bin.137]|uniref:transposase n=1 Tax=Acaryochloris sp. IP29b_bin.137 TaxID=2969217 RepID=UPI002612DD09|nr:transposase [Acaryochloris sp. IP29b_bin.137]